MSGKIWSGGALPCLLLAMTSCAFDTGTAEQVEATEAAPGEAQQALCDPKTSDDCCNSAQYSQCFLQPAPANADFKIKIYHCKDTGPGYLHRATCPVEPGWTVIGGGGEVMGVPVGDAQLLSSRPSDDIHTNLYWRVQSADTRHVNYGNLALFSIGMKMKGYDNSSPENYAPIQVSYARGQYGGRSTATVQVPNGQLLIGGGFNTRERLYVVDAYATGMLNGSWIVNGSDFGFDMPYFVEAYAVSVDLCPSRWSSCFSDRKIVRNDSDTGNDIQAAFAMNQADGFYPTGVGFISSSWERTVFRAIPIPAQYAQNGGAAVGTWSWLPSGTGFVRAQGIFLKR